MPNLYILTHEGSYVGGTLIVSADRFEQIPELILQDYRETGSIEQHLLSGPGYKYGPTWDSPYDYLFNGDNSVENGVVYRTGLTPIYRNRQDDDYLHYLLLERVIENVSIDEYGIISSTYHDG
jgi:hypothetical protein